MTAVGALQVVWWMARSKMRKIIRQFLVRLVRLFAIPTSGDRAILTSRLILDARLTHAVTFTSPELEFKTQQGPTIFAATFFFCLAYLAFALLRAIAPNQTFSSEISLRTRCRTVVWSIKPKVGSKVSMAQLSTASIPL